MAVQVANGDTFTCPGYCKGVNLVMQACNIITNLFLLTLGGCDVVLGVDWLRSLGTINWNFAELSMRFIMGGKEITLQGLKAPKHAVEEEPNLNKVTLTKGKGIWLQLMKITAPFGAATTEPSIQAVLDGFKSVFNEPKGLPPFRSHDHQI